MSYDCAKTLRGSLSTPPSLLPNKCPLSVRFFHNQGALMFGALRFLYWALLWWCMHLFLELYFRVLRDSVLYTISKLCDSIARVCTVNISKYSLSHAFRVWPTIGGITVRLGCVRLYCSQLRQGIFPVSCTHSDALYWAIYVLMESMCASHTWHCAPTGLAHWLLPQLDPNPIRF